MIYSRHDKHFKQLQNVIFFVNTISVMREKFRTMPRVTPPAHNLKRPFISSIFKWERQNTTRTSHISLTDCTNVFASLGDEVLHVNIEYAYLIRWFTGYLFSPNTRYTPYRSCSVQTFVLHYYNNERNNLFPSTLSNAT